MPKLNSIVTMSIDTDKRECVCDIATSVIVETENENNVEIYPSYHDQRTFKEGISFESMWKKVGEIVGKHATNYGDMFGC